MIYTLLSVYNEAHNLPRAIQSVRNVFGPDASLVFVDGRYPDFEGTSEFSTDSTKQIALSHGAYLAIHDYECEKRTAGLRYIDTVATDGDWILYLDADETITELFGPLPERVGKIDFTRRSDGRDYRRNRLYRWEMGLSFRSRHYDLFSASGEHVATLEDGPFELVGAGVHYDESHNPVRMKHKRDYYRNLRKREGSPWLQPTP